jgi:hypothetical protein
MELPRFDLPLRQSAASRFLPWTIGGLLFLAIVALGVAAIADEALRGYGMRIKIVTVTLPVFESGDGQQELAAALDILRNTRGVSAAAPVPVAEVAILVEPWMGDLEAEMDLPLPRLIDVTLDPRTHVIWRHSSSNWVEWPKARPSVPRCWPVIVPSDLRCSCGRGASPAASRPWRRCWRWSD